MTEPEPQPQPPADDSNGRLQIRLAVIAQVGAVIAAVVAGLFAFAGAGSSESPQSTPPPVPSTSPVVASGGDVRQGEGCVINGSVVYGPVDCPEPQTAPGPPTLTITPRASKLLSVAFAHDPGTPAEADDWEALIDKGGIDEGGSEFGLALSNPTKHEIVVTEIHAEVTGLEPPPRAALAYTFTQGSGDVEAFTVQLDRFTPGTSVPLHRSPGGVVDEAAYFPQHAITLAPGEIYVANVSVRTLDHTPHVVRYRFVANGAQADGPFKVESDEHRLSALADERGGKHSTYAKYYSEGFLEYMRSNCANLKVRRWYAEPPGGTGACP